MAILVEKNAGAKIDYRDLDTYQILFKDYWEMIKDRERLTMVDLQEASARFDTSLSCKRGADSVKFPNEGHKSAENLLGDNDDNEETFPFDSKGKPNKVTMSLKRNRSNKKTYVDWGSEELIEFLSCLGKDTKKPLDGDGIVGVVKEYINQKNLFLNNKKKAFMCDDKLRPLFTRSKVKYNMLHSKLEKHLAENADLEDESIDGSEDDDVPTMKKKPRTSVEPKIAKRVPKRNKRCFASLSQNNIKLTYLRRSLVINFLNHLDTFEQKVVGCFVRVKNDPKVHYYQMSKKAYQLGLVTGIKKSVEEYKIKDTCTHILLCVTGLWDDIKISMLSDEDFLEDECNDLIPLVEKGLLKRATVAELEEKVATIHTDIVNHWIDRELARLGKQIERAHEKGWHRELEQLMHQRKLLSTPAERQRRLEEIPEIIADMEHEKQETEVEIAADNSSQRNRGKEGDRACLVNMKENSKGATQQVPEIFNVIREEPPKGAAEHVAESFEVLKEKAPEGAAENVVDSLDILNEESSEGAADQVADALRVREEELPEGATEKMANSLSLPNKESSQVASKQGDAAHGVASEAGEDLSSGATPDNVPHSQMYNTLDGSTAEVIDIDKDESNHSRSNKSGNIPVDDVIDLVSDEEDLHTEQREPGRKASPAPRAMNGGDLHIEQPNPASRAASHAPGATNGVLCPEQRRPAHAAATNGLSPDKPLWYYVDPQGHPRGPFSSNRLSQWKENGFFDGYFRVWMRGKTMEQAILLTEAIRMCSAAVHPETA